MRERESPLAMDVKFGLLLSSFSAKCTTRLLVDESLGTRLCSVAGMRYFLPAIVATLS